MKQQTFLRFGNNSQNDNDVPNGNNRKFHDICQKRKRSISTKEVSQDLAQKSMFLLRMSLGVKTIETNCILVQKDIAKGALHSSIFLAKTTATLLSAGSGMWSSVRRLGNILALRFPGREAV